MKSKLLIFAFLFFQVNYAQDSLKTNSLDEVKITKKISKKVVKGIIGKILDNLRNNYETDSRNYHIKHFSVKNNNDTLINKAKPVFFKIKNLTQKNIAEELRGNYSNSFYVDVSPYSSYEPDLDSTHWLAMSIFYDSMKVIDFDFFKYFSTYDYTLIDNGESKTIKFYAKLYYEGYFTYDKNYNIQRIIFKSTKKYDYYVLGHVKNPQNYLEFKSDWEYNKVAIKLDFEITSSNKLLLSSLSSMQELTNFKYSRFNEFGRRIGGDSGIKFYTTFQMNLLK
jgi:hypothetical protein